MTARMATLSLLAPLTLLALALFVSTPAAAFPERWDYDRLWPALGGGDFVLADFTGDGIEDLAAVDDTAQAVHIYEGTAAGIPHDPATTLATGDVTALASADLDGDGRLDLITVGASQAFWFRWNGDVPKATPQNNSLALEGAPFAVAPGDFDDDGDTDLAVLGFTVSRIWFQVDGDFVPGANLTLTTDEHFHGIAAGDVDGDGRDDVVLAKPREIRVYLQRASGLDLDPVRNSTLADGEVSLALLPTPDSVDGVPYVAVVGAWEPSETGGLSLWQWENSTLVLRSAIRIPDAMGIAVGDVNDDLRPDILLSRVNGDTHIFLQLGGAQVATIPDLVLTGLETSGTSSATVGDVNGDGFEDIVLRAANPDHFVAYLQEDAPPVLAKPIPSTYSVNRGTYASGVVDLREYFADDHDVLTFQIVSSSDEDLLNASIDGTTLTFDATPDAYGSAEFRVAAWDRNPSHTPVESNSFSVTVNDVPVVVSAPPLRATVGEPYAYVIRVFDAFPQIEHHAYGLVVRPDGMSIDPATGLITWTPREEQAGAHSVAAEIRDNNGGRSLHTFSLVVAPISPGSPVALMAVGLVGTTAALLAAAALINENAKWAFLLFIIPLYSKIKRERVLDHFVRGQIFGYIQANPGEHYNAIKDALGLTNGSLAHHLRTLEREQFVKSRRFGLYRRFYPMQYRIPDQESFKPNEVQRAILSVIRQSPGITQKDIANRLGLTPPTVNYHITQLGEHNLIQVVRHGRSTHCSIVDGPT